MKPTAFVHTKKVREELSPHSLEKQNRAKLQPEQLGSVTNFDSKWHKSSSQAKKYHPGFILVDCLRHDARTQNWGPWGSPWRQGGSWPLHSTLFWKPSPYLLDSRFVFKCFYFFCAIDRPFCFQSDCFPLPSETKSFCLLLYVCVCVFLSFPSRMPFPHRDKSSLTWVRRQRALLRREPESLTFHYPSPSLERQMCSAMFGRHVSTRDMFEPAFSGLWASVMVGRKLCSRG